MASLGWKTYMVMDATIFVSAMFTRVWIVIDRSLAWIRPFSPGTS